ncbi:hypothetical protein ACOXXX_17130 [Thalassococcus sp. BH17M4-6]|uniref:hypothetical protein n=1 Tax=Thalassococcus sp. BH17M4-6 TaxID=3413148 RepID=UPI003BE26042
MTADLNHTATLVFDKQRLFSTDTLGALLNRGMQQMGVSGCDAPRATMTGAAMATDTLRATLDVDMTADGTQLLVSLCGTNESAASVQAKLAGLVYHLSTELPVTHIGWLDTGTLLPRDGFLDALAPQLDARGNVTGIAPRRPARPAVKTARPDTRTHRDTLSRMLPPVSRSGRPRSANMNAKVALPRYDAHVRTYNANLRFQMLRDADEMELDAVREEQGPAPVEARLSTWAVSLSVATISLPVAAPVMIYNIARGEDMRVASLAMGVAGLFLALDNSGTLAGLLGSV